MADNWYQENKRTVTIIVVLVAVVLTVFLMFKFWTYTLVAVSAFLGGYIVALRNKKEKTNPPS